MSKNIYIKRKLEDTILQYLDRPEVIAVVGPRQAGKTTLLYHIFEQVKDRAIFLSFEDQKILNFFTQNIDEFIELYVTPYKYTFVDEFYYAKQGGKSLKYIFDKTKAKFIISGSSNVDLTIEAVKYLVGRIFVFSLFPLDFDEILAFKDPNLFKLYKKSKINLKGFSHVSGKADSLEILADIKKYYQDYLLYGGYPRIILSDAKKEKEIVLRNIYNTYFLREVRDILGLIDDYKFSQMIKVLALQVGNLIDYGEISNMSGLNFRTVKSYLNFLEKTFICRLVRPYFKNKRTEIVKNPKVFFFDNGLRNLIVDDFRKIEDRPDGGAVLENGLAMQLIKQELNFNFWRNKQKSEIDFVVNLPEAKQIGLEVKKSIKSSDLNSKSARDFMAAHKDIPLFFGVYDIKNNLTDRTFFTAMI